MPTLSTISYASLFYGSNQASSTPTDAVTQAIDAVREKAAAQKATTVAHSGVSISDAALGAAAKADNKKDFTVLAGEVRAELDKQYTANKAAGLSARPDLSDLSGRALAAVVVDEGNQFTPAERAAARLELRARQQADFMAATASGNLLSAVQAYSTNLISQYDSMSTEERQARGWNSNVRTSAADFVKTSKANLFDQTSVINPSSW